LQRSIVLPLAKVQPPEVGVHDQRKGIDFERLLNLSDAFVQAARWRQYLKTIEIVRGSVSRVQLDRPLELALGSTPLALVRQGCPHGRMGFRQGIIQLQGAFCRLTGFGIGLEWSDIRAVWRDDAIGVSQANPGQSVVRVLLQCALEELNALMQRLPRALVPVVAAS